MNIVTWKEGIDLYFKSKNQAEKGNNIVNTNYKSHTNTTTVVEYLSSILPTRAKISRKLVSRDSHTGITNPNTTTYTTTSTAVNTFILSMILYRSFSN